MRRMLNNRIYPSAKGGYRRMFDEKDVIGLNYKGKVCLRSEGYFPQVRIKVGDTIEKLDMLYCDFDLLDTSKCEKATYESEYVTKAEYYMLTRFNCVAGYTYPYGALAILADGSKKPYVLLFNKNTDTEAVNRVTAVDFVQNKYGYCTFIPGNAKFAPFIITKDAGGLSAISQIKQMEGVKDGATVKTTYTYYYDINEKTGAGTSKVRTMFVVTTTSDGVAHTIKWTGSKVTDNDSEVTITKDGFVVTFKLSVAGTVSAAAVWPQTYYVEE